MEQDMYKLKNYIDSLELALDHLPVFVGIFDGEGKCFYVNSAVKDIAGYDPKELIDRQILFFVHPEDMMELKELLAKVARTGLESQACFRLQHKNGHYVPLECAMKCQAEGSLEITIYGRMAYEEQETPENLFEILGQAICVWEPQHDFLNWYGVSSSSLRTIIGGLQTRENMQKLIHPDDQNKVMGELCNAVSDESIINVNYRLKNNDNSYVWVNERGFAGTKDKVPYVLSGIRENKASKTTAADPQLERLRCYRTSLKAMGNIMYEYKVNDRLIILEGDCCSLLGYGREGAVLNFESWLEMIHANYQADYILEQEKCIQENCHFNSEYRLKSSNGTYRWLRDFGVPVLGRNNKVERIIGIISDMTSWKNMELELQGNLEKLKDVVNGAVEAIMLTVKTKDPFTAEHQRRVAILAAAIADKLGLPYKEIEEIYIAGFTHDIGKIYVPGDILSRPSSLSNNEFNLIKEHPMIGCRILQQIEFPWTVADIVMQHHERVDGSGYPRGLKGREISYKARLLAVADVIEAMTSHRPYRPALGLEMAFCEIEENQDSLYDGDVVEASIEVVSNDLVNAGFFSSSQRL